MDFEITVYLVCTRWSLFDWLTVTININVFHIQLIQQFLDKLLVFILILDLRAAGSAYGNLMLILLLLYALSRLFLFSFLIFHLYLIGASVTSFI